ncbi:hypothetical protein DPMN_076010 [Dreissena polymorpha]|uniref:Uncharacterized protein n=1 Tax=Dreissena polymorpha TaxID=45954 RepID=A0A9D3YHZ5_DREPO|nr:hypothetical protein DPMN_075977 [Dreissena polymorpha]KAH3701027.1 hypothetical protein DPMN_076010 [Dreissena polymorpha]
MFKFHEDWEKMCLLDCSHKTAPLPGGHVFSLIMTIFKLVRDIHITNAKHVTSSVHKLFYYINIRKKTPPGSHVFYTNPNHYRLAVSFAYANETVTGWKNAPPLGSHVFQAKVTIFELIHGIIGTNHLSKFHEDRKINVASRVLRRKNATPPGGHVFQPTDIIFILVQDIIGMNLLTTKNAPPLGSHVFQAKVTIFELIQDIIETYLLTKFLEDWKINVASRG